MFQCRGPGLVAPWQLKPTATMKTQPSSPPHPPKKNSWMFQLSISHCKCFRKDVFEEGDQQQCEGETDTAEIPAKRYCKNRQGMWTGYSRSLSLRWNWGTADTTGWNPAVGKMLEPGKTSVCRNTRRWDNSIHKGGREVSWAAASLGLAKPISLLQLCHGFPPSIPTAVGSRPSCDW